MKHFEVKTQIDLGDLMLGEGILSATFTGPQDGGRMLNFKVELFLSDAWHDVTAIVRPYALLDLQKEFVDAVIKEIAGVA